MFFYPKKMIKFCFDFCNIGFENVDPFFHSSATPLEFQKIRFHRDIENLDASN